VIEILDSWIHLDVFSPVLVLARAHLFLLFRGRDVIPCHTASAMCGSTLPAMHASANFLESCKTLVPAEYTSYIKQMP
jgi:hypothetical protein